MDIKFFLDVPENIFSYILKLQKDRLYLYDPTLAGVTDIGHSISLGYSCYALKIYYMTSKWDDIPKEQQENWINFIRSFQVTLPGLPPNSFVDIDLLDSFNNLKFTEKTKHALKTILTTLNIKQYDSKNVAIRKAINAETKQALSTLSEVESFPLHNVPMPFNDSVELHKYLNQLDWNRPWASGAQFSSFCVYSKVNDEIHKHELEKFINSLSRKNTGSYHNEKLNDKREIINGAMKIISGLDWLDIPIHNPKELIDFCLINVPTSEGCDVVDFVYVLYKCSKQTSYRKKEINNLFVTILEQLKKLYNFEENAFSYFERKSQTHYYGANISEGLNHADIHGSLLCLWAVLMILDNLELKEEKLRIIKP